MRKTIKAQNLAESNVSTIKARMYQTENEMNDRKNKNKNYLTMKLIMDWIKDQRKIYNILTSGLRK